MHIYALFDEKFLKKDEKMSDFLSEELSETRELRATLAYVYGYISALTKSTESTVPMKSIDDLKSMMETVFKSRLKSNA